MRHVLSMLLFSDLENSSIERTDQLEVGGGPSDASRGAAYERRNPPAISRACKAKARPGPGACSGARRSAEDVVSASLEGSPIASKATNHPPGRRLTKTPRAS